MEWIILAIFLLWLFGQFQRGNSTHPANALAGTAVASSTATPGATSGDTFNSGVPTVAAGVTEPVAATIGTRKATLPYQLPRTNARVSSQLFYPTCSYVTNLYAKNTIPPGVIASPIVPSSSQNIKLGLPKSPVRNIRIL